MNTIGNSICYVWDMLARPHSIAAVLVILFVHYRSALLNFFHRAINDGFLETFFSLILNLADTLRAYYHISHEIVRGIGQNHTFSFVTESYGGHHTRRPSQQKESGNFRPNRNDHKTNSSSGPLPQLVDVRSSTAHEEGEFPASKNGPLPTMVANGSKPKPSIDENDMAQLEPAFLSKEDYPPGWLVYHPVLGLASLKEADQHDEQQSLKKQACEENSHLQEEHDLQVTEQNEKEL